MCDTHIHIIVKQKEEERGVRERKQAQVKKILDNEDRRNREGEMSCELV